MNAPAVGAVGADSQAPAVAPVNKPKRVRTGCLTCRERHLKCDEGLPICQNCRKSNRQCKRGVRLNFIDTNVKLPPVLAPTHDWNVNFLDESRDIASEYKGGLSRYGLPEDKGHVALDSAVAFDFAPTAPHVQLPQHQALPSIQGMLPEGYAYDPGMAGAHHQDPHNHHGRSHSESNYSGSNMPAPTSSTFSNPDHNAAQGEQSREYMENPEEVLFMQVFVEEVGLWMDSMDAVKHVSPLSKPLRRGVADFRQFSELLPFHSLREPMLYNAFLACGARHLALVNPKYSEDKALHYYNTATTYLLTAIQNPNRDTVICATTAVVLNVYEVMSERPLQRMNHNAGARALVKECGWNARSTGIGAACFWLNIGMELLSCLHFNWQPAWEPDEWGLDMDFARETEHGREEVWTHRILYIVAKICNFRVSAPRQSGNSPQAEQMRLQSRYAEWKRLKSMADAWNDAIPRTMHPMAYLQSYATMSGSNFPEVWLLKRATIVARLFYHTALVLLAQTNPIAPRDSSSEMRDLQQRNSVIICGIVAHVKDRGVASVALRALAIAADSLQNRREQEEVVQIFTKIRQETGWQIGSVLKDLMLKWHWSTDEAAQHQQQLGAAHATQQQLTPSQPSAGLQFPQVSMQPPLPQQQAAVTAMSPVTPVRPRNPLLATDFTMTQHPYHNYYVVPNSVTPHSHFTY